MVNPAYAAAPQTVIVTKGGWVTVEAIPLSPEVIKDSGKNVLLNKSTNDPVDVEQYVRSYFADAPIMGEVARCESEFIQFNKDGSIRRGRENSKDVGVMQINERYHLEASKKMGIDIYTLDGNLAYAKYLYEEQGTDPWSASAPCWKKSAKVAQTAKATFKTNLATNLR